MNAPVFRTIDLSAIASLAPALRPVRIPAARRSGLAQACALLASAERQTQAVHARAEATTAAARAQADDIVEAAHVRAAAVAAEFDAEMALAREQFVDGLVTRCTPILAGVVAEAIREVLGQIEIDHLAVVAVSRLLEREAARLSAANLHVPEGCDPHRLPALPPGWSLREPTAARNEATLETERGRFTVRIGLPEALPPLDGRQADGGTAASATLDFLDID